MAHIKASEDLRPVSELKSSGAEIVRQVNTTGRPVVLTRHGRGVAVLVSLERYEELERAVDRAEVQRAILEGESSVKIHGHDIPVKATIEGITGFSGHGDYNEMLGWLMGFNRPPERTFIVHGEPGASKSMAEKIRAKFGWDVHVPALGEMAELAM